MHLTGNGLIAAQATHASGGNIIVIAPQLLHVQKGRIVTNVVSGKGSGGNITVDRAYLTALNSGEIIANAHGGEGGNISLQADQYIASPNSIVDASSKLGIDGEIRVKAPDSNIGEQLIALPKNFPNPSLSDPCVTQLSAEKSSRFVHINRIGKWRDELSDGVLGSYSDIITKP